MSLRLWLTVAAALVIAVGAFIFATRGQRGKQQLVIAVLPRADGVREGMPVTYRGLDIGYVERLRIDQGRVVAELRIRRADAGIRREDTLKVRTMGLIGDKSLDFSPGVVSAPLVVATDTIFAVVP